MGFCNFSTDEFNNNRQSLALNEDDEKMFKVMEELLQQSYSYDELQIVERRAQGASTDVKFIHYDTV